jgi:ABC-type dipeptide/oligopeptide/nickel transport system permease component
VRLGVLPLSTPSPIASLQVDMLRTVEQRHDRMVPYIIRRLLWMVPTLLAMALMTFTIMHLTPGSPLDPVADNANPLSPEAQRNMAKQYGLDKPLWQQFVILLYGVF